MANTPKPPEKRKTAVLRIPLTPEQHGMISELHGDNMAEWARGVLFARLDAEFAERGKSSGRKKAT